MRIVSFLFLSLASVTLMDTIEAHAQINARPTLTTNLSLGSQGDQVLALQQILNRNPETHVANTGPGSPGNETDRFGTRTRAAVIRFQEKYADEVLSPAGLTKGNGYVGTYTRMKLNALSVPKVSTEKTDLPTTSPASVATTSTTAQTSPAPSSSDYAVTDTEKIDIYAGDKMLAIVRQKLLASINSSIISGGSAPAAPAIITAKEVPSVSIGTLSPQSGVPGTRTVITGSGITENSVVYFGDTYIVRTVKRDLSGNFSFIVPLIPTGRYDLAVKTGAHISNTAVFVIRDPRNPPVHLQSISSNTIKYGDTITVTGSGFSSQDNIVVTTYQTFKNIPSHDGSTLSIRVAPEILKEAVSIGDGTRKIPMSLYIINDYDFSDSQKSFTMAL